MDIEMGLAKYWYWFSYWIGTQPNFDIDFEIEMGLGQILILISILKWDLPNIDFDIESQNPILLMSAMHCQHDATILWRKVSTV